MDEEDALYGLPLENFVSERDALARRMRAAGDREGSARVKGLRKPTVAAWAVNQVARTQGAALRELDEAGKALRQAHASLLRGKAGSRELRAASERERAAVEALVTAARGLLSSAGRDLSETALRDVRDSLHAMASEEEARAAVLGGRLDRERHAAGLGGELGFAGPVARSARPRKDTGDAKAAVAKSPKTAKAKGKREPASARRAKEDSAAQAAATKTAAAKAASAKAAAAKVAAATEAAQRAEREHGAAVARLEAAEDALKAARGARDEARYAERDARRAREKAAKQAREAIRRS